MNLFLISFEEVDAIYYQFMYSLVLLVVVALYSFQSI